MNKKVKIASDSNKKDILNDALNSSENEQLDLYKAVFGGRGSDCAVVAARTGRRSSARSAYDRTDVFLQAAV